MIQPHLFFCGLVGGFVLGLIYGRRKFYEQGWDNGYRCGKSPKPPTLEEYHRIKRVSVTHLMEVCDSWDVEDLELHSTFAVHEIAKLLADDLLAKKFIRPVILSRDEPGFPGAWKIHASVLVIRDPDFDEYPTLNYINDIPKTSE